MQVKNWLVHPLEFWAAVPHGDGLDGMKTFIEDIDPE